MAFPIVTSLAVVGVTAPALLITLAVVAGFLAHEPLLVLLGKRGARVRRDNRSGARWWFAVTTATAAAAGILAWRFAAADIRCSLMFPLLPAVCVAAAIPARREKSAAAEIAVALTFSSVATPLCLAAGAHARTAAVVGIVFALVFVADTLAVRSVILAARGGNTRAARSTRIAVLLLAATGCGALALCAAEALLPWAALLASAPGLGAAAWLVLFPPAPSRLRRVGWTLVAATAASALILVGGLPSR